MRETNVKTWLVALIIALLPCVAGAAGLGRLTVLTALGQPLVAEIELVAVTPQELSSLNARLALPDAYRDANLQYNVALTGAQVTVEKRPNGRSYLKVVTTRAVTEPFIDLVVELTWAAGRLTREYTALLDPPGIPPLPATPMMSAAPEARPAPAPAPMLAPAPEPARAPEPAVAPAPAPVPPVTVESQPAPAAIPTPVPAPVAPVVSSPVIATPMTASNEYGPIERGETLGKIARSVMPEDVSLEQMLVALYRTNSEAFIRKNLNLVRAGKILRVPDRDEIDAISRGEALKEYRAHVAEWNDYRQRLAEAAVTVAAEKSTTVSGKIATKVKDKAAAGTPKDVVRLSKGEPADAAAGTAAGKGKPRSSAERIRILEEEAIAREKALAEASSRITQLEKTIQDMKKLAELKSPGMAAAQQQAQRATAPVAKPAPQPTPVAKPVPKPTPAKPEMVAVAKPVTAPAPAPKPAAAPTPTPQPQPAARPKAKPAPLPPMQEPELMDEIMAVASNPLYLGAGGAIVLGGLAFWMVRRRRAVGGRSDSPPIAPRLGMAAAATAGAAAVTGYTAEDSTVETAAAASVDDVDPLQEAEVYIQYGRDGQAEEILRDALARKPGREDVQLKLLEVYAGRKDKDAFGRVAADLSRQTGGAGANWLKAAAMGFALDPANALYEAGRDATTATVVRPVGTSSEIDLDLGGSGLPRVSTDIMLDAGAVEAATVVTDTSILGAMAANTVKMAEPPRAPMPDFTLEVPPAGVSAETDIALEAGEPERNANVIDFQIELPRAAEEPATVTSAESADAGLDFKIEGLDLKLEKEPSTMPAGAGKDGHWYDVQTKFDLAKAYQEMGDRDGAKEILQEVIKEGDGEQQSQAQKLMDSLG
ncbi:MAG TPA: FimV/HubP family polar landmark protein [Burkholderiales bacterium]